MKGKFTLKRKLNLRKYLNPNDKQFEMKKIFAQLPEMSQRQTLLFSATWPKSIRKLAATFLKEDAQELFIGNAGNPNAELEANKAVSQWR